MLFAVIERFFDNFSAYLQTANSRGSVLGTVIQANRTLELGDELRIGNQFEKRKSLLLSKEVPTYTALLLLMGLRNFLPSNFELVDLK